MKSLREQAHAKQHQLLKEYPRARTERMCSSPLRTSLALTRRVSTSGINENTRRTSTAERTRRSRLVSSREDLHPASDEYEWWYFRKILE